VPLQHRRDQQGGKKKGTAAGRRGIRGKKSKGENGSAYSLLTPTLLCLSRRKEGKKRSGSVPGHLCSQLEKGKEKRVVSATSLPAPAAAKGRGRRRLGDPLKRRKGRKILAGWGGGGKKKRERSPEKSVVGKKKKKKGRKKKGETYFLRIKKKEKEEGGRRHTGSPIAALPS